MATSTALDQAIRTPVPILGRPPGRAIGHDGLIAGAIGFGVIVAAFGVMNAIIGRPVLHTAGILGAAPFDNAKDPMSVTLTPAGVMPYSAAHLAVFLIARHPRLQRRESWGDGRGAEEMQ